MASTWQIFLIVYFIIEWVLRIGMLFVVPNNKRPSSATAWILLIMIVPVLGALLFAMFGNPRLPRRRRDAQSAVDNMTAKELKTIQEHHPQLIKPLVNKDADNLEALAYRTGGLPAFHGNDVSLIRDYQQTLGAYVLAIQNAKKYIHVEFFILGLDSTSERVFVALEEAVERGVTVRVLYDRFASARYPGYRAMVARLKSSGVQWRAMLPYRLIPGREFTRPDLRNHRKLLIVDGEVAFSGSQNLITPTYHRRDDIMYEELTVQMSGPVVWQCNNVFRADWFAETHEPLLDLVENEDVPAKTGDTTLQIVPSSPSHVYDNNLLLYTSMFHVAKKRISIVVPYFVPDDSIMVALTAAAQSGVEVIMINSASIDKLFTGHAQRSYYDELLQAGVKIYLYKKPIFLHTKQVIIDDDIAIVGSSNLDIRSFELALEVNMVIYDSQVVKQLRDIESDYLTRSTSVTKKKWATRAFREKLLDRLSRLTAALQ